MDGSLEPARRINRWESLRRRGEAGLTGVTLRSI
jgi:hypothetical protein